MRQSEDDSPTKQTREKSLHTFAIIFVVNIPSDKQGSSKTNNCLSIPHNTENHSKHIH